MYASRLTKTPQLAVAVAVVLAACCGLARRREGGACSGSGSDACGGSGACGSVCSGTCGGAGGAGPGVNSKGKGTGAVPSPRTAARRLRGIKAKAKTSVVD